MWQRNRPIHLCTIQPCSRRKKTRRRICLHAPKRLTLAKRNRPERWKATWSLLLRQGGKPRKSRAARHLRQLASQTGRRRPPQPGSHLRQQCRNPTQTTRTKPRPLSRHRRPAWQSRNTRLLRSSWERHHRTPETSYGRLCPARCPTSALPPFRHPKPEGASHRQTFGRSRPPKTNATPRDPHCPNRLGVRSIEEGRRAAAPTSLRRPLSKGRRHTKPHHPHRRNASRTRCFRQGEMSLCRNNLLRTTRHPRGTSLLRSRRPQ